MPDFVRRDIEIPITRYDAETRTVSGVISSESLDAFGDQIDQAGIKIRSSVPLLWSHDPRSPIGRSVAFRRDGDRTLAQFRLASQGVDATADRIHALAKDGVVSSLSVGLLPKRWEGNRLAESELMEVSMVSVPANRDAQVTAVRTAPVTVDETGTPRVVTRERITAPAVHRHNPDAQRWDFARFLAMIAPNQAPAGIDTGYEREVSDELNRYSSRAGFKMPLLHLVQRAIGTKPADAGAALTGVDFRSDLFGLDVEAIRPATIMGRAGARMITTTEPLVTVPRQVSPLPDAEWIPRDGDLTLQGDLGTKSLDLTPHEVGSYHKILRSGRLYGTPNLVDLYTQQIIGKQLYAIDLAVLYGTGAPQPEGLTMDPRTQTYGMGAAPPAAADPTLIDLVKMSGMLDGTTAPEDSRVWLMNSLMRSTLQATKKFDDTSCCETIMSEGDGTLLQHPVVTGQQLPPSDIWFLDAGQTGIVWFAQGASTIEVVQNPFADSVFPSGALLLRAINDVDVFALDAYRAVWCGNGKTIGTVTPPVPRVAKAAPANGGRVAADNGPTGPTGPQASGHSSTHHRR